PYNFKALGADQNSGALHPLNKVRHEFRQIFFEMGFEEMPTNKYVESGFWNFDALFVPQQHPARDLQDTFYISDPKVAGRPGPESEDDKKDYETYWENVKQVHQDGKYGSIGYRYPWEADESLKLVLRTHTTSDKLEAASNVSPDHPVVITKFIEGAQEIDVDGVASDGKLILHAVSEHVEQAGVHSGDATLVLPPANLEQSIMDRVKEIAEKVAKAWKITGPFNMQIIKADDPAGGEAALKVIECNLRASRSFPFVSKVLGTNFIDVATKALVGQQVPEPVDLMAVKRDYVATKVPQFSWTRLAGADPFLGVEMASTGEIACFGKDLVEAYWASLQSTMNFRMPEPGEGLLFGGELSEPWLTTVVDHLAPLGFKLFAADAEVKRFIESSAKGGTSVEVIEFPKEDKRALREVFQKYDIRGVFNLARARGKTVMDVDYVMRRNAVDFGVPLFMEPKVS
ncbi:hypothetical protein BN1708_016820, partial [Verticillium longisporum]